METCPKCRKLARIRRATQQLVDRNKCYRDKNGRMVMVMKSTTIATCSQCGNTWTEGR